MTTRQLIVLAVCVAIFALGQFHRASGSIFTPLLMEQFALTAAVVAGLVSAMFFATIAAQMPFGWALDRLGPRPVLTLSILLVALGTLLFALAGSYAQVLAARILIGVGLASMGAASHVIIARNFPAADFGYMSGLVVTLGGIGGLLGTFPLAFALERAPWGGVFGGVALVTLGLSFVVFKAVRPAAPVRKSGSQGTDAGARAGGYLELLKLPGFRAILALSIVTYAPITTVTGLWGGPFLQDTLGFSPEAAGGTLSVLFAATILGGYFFGLLDRHAPSRRSVILGGAGMSVLCLAALAVLPGQGSLLPVMLLLSMVLAQQFYVPLGAQMRHAVPDHLLGRASTLFNLLAVAAIPLLQLGFGAVLDACAAAGWSEAAQFRAAFGVMGAVIGLCLLGYLLLNGRR